MIKYSVVCFGEDDSLEILDVLAESELDAKCVAWYLGFSNASIVECEQIIHAN